MTEIPLFVEVWATKGNSPSDHNPVHHPHNPVRPRPCENPPPTSAEEPNRLVADLRGSGSSIVIRRPRRRGRRGLIRLADPAWHQVHRRTAHADDVAMFRPDRRFALPRFLGTSSPNTNRLVILARVAFTRGRGAWLPTARPGRYVPSRTAPCDTTGAHHPRRVVFSRIPSLCMILFPRSQWYNAKQRVHLKQEFTLMATVSEIKPTENLRLIDLLRTVGVDVSDWANCKRGPRYAASNPKYCYEWSFVEPGRFVVLTIW